MDTVLRHRAVFAVALLLAVAVFAGLYLANLVVVKDVSFEAMDIPLTVHHMERARAGGTPLKEYFARDPCWENLKREDPKGAYAYFGDRFQFEFFAFQAPTLCIAFWPFVKGLGVSPAAVAGYSTGFSLLVILATAWLAWRAYGRWHALLAASFLFTSLTWLIHTKVAYAAWMPSAFLVVLLAIALLEYLRRPRPGPLLVVGIALGWLYLVGWIVVVFALLTVLLVLATEIRRRKFRLLLDGALVGGTALAAAAGITALYCAVYRCPFLDVQSAIWDVMFGRFSQGAVPHQQLPLLGRIGYALKCLFVDSTTFDHLDKCLEGIPAVSLLFALFAGAGIVYALRRRTPADRLLLLWCLAVFGFLFAVFLYTHRYALIGLPAMAILAARGVVGVADSLAASRFRRAFPVYAVAVVTGLLLVAAMTYYRFFASYIPNKKAEFEQDRARGHYAMTQWIKKGGPPAKSLVVLGDSIMFPHTAFLFHTADSPYDFVYWSNYFGTTSTAAQVRDWEDRMLQKYERLAFAFSTTMFGNPQGQVANDWRPFQAAHPGILNTPPPFVYQYDKRDRPFILGFEVFRKPVPADPAPASAAAAVPLPLR